MEMGLAAPPKMAARELMIRMVPSTRLVQLRRNLTEEMEVVGTVVCLSSTDCSSSVNTTEDSALGADEPEMAASSPIMSVFEPVVSSIAAIVTQMCLGVQNDAVGYNEDKGMPTLGSNTLLRLNSSRKKSRKLLDPMTDPILHSLTLASVCRTAVCKVNAAEEDPFSFQQLRLPAGYPKVCSGFPFWVRVQALILVIIGEYCSLEITINLILWSAGVRG